MANVSYYIKVDSHCRARISAKWSIFDYFYEQNAFPSFFSLIHFYVSLLLVSCCYLSPSIIHSLPTPSVSFFEEFLLTLSVHVLAYGELATYYGYASVMGTTCLI